MNSMLRTARCGALVHVALSIYHLLLGTLTASWWLLTLGVYYLLLSIVRIVVLRTPHHPRFALRFTGITLIVLSLPLAGTVLLSVLHDRGHQYHIIIMIAMAAYAFAKITLATVNLVRVRRSRSALRLTLRNISFADAAVSIFALQRSMLATFEGMTGAEIRLMNALLGTAVCLLVPLLGVHLLKNKNFQKRSSQNRSMGL